MLRVCMEVRLWYRPELLWVVYGATGMTKLSPTAGYAKAICLQLGALAFVE